MFHFKNLPLCQRDALIDTRKVNNDEYENLRAAISSTPCDRTASRWFDERTFWIELSWQPNALKNFLCWKLG